MVKPVDALQRAAKDGAAGKAVEKDIQAYQQARLMFVNAIRVLWSHLDVAQEDLRRLCISINIECRII